MEYKEYIVVLKQGTTYQKVWSDIENQTIGLSHIPDRPVAIAHDRSMFDRICEYWLTETEAEILKNDPRIESVEQPVRNLPQVQLVSNATQNIPGMNYTKQAGNITMNYTTGVSTVDPSDYTAPFNASINWGLIRHSFQSNPYPANPTGNSAATTALYNYVLDGSGVDIIVNDSGIQQNHPEFAGRIIDVDWDAIAAKVGSSVRGWNTASYTDTDGHGTHVAATAAGAVYGWAKGAKILPLCLSLSGQSSSDPLDMFEMMIYWHKNKGNNRPTVVNMSWDLRFNFSAPYNQGMGYCNYYFSGGSYRGATWSGPQTNGFFQSRGLIALTGNGWPGQGNILQFPYSSAAYNAALAQVIDAGIVVCQAAGNNGFKIDVPGGPDYNNYVLSGGTYYYHRGASPKDPRAIVVGALDNKSSASAQDQRAAYSGTGPGVDIWAAGTYIMSAGCQNPTPGSRQARTGDADYFPNQSFKEWTTSGTSMATPQITGMSALLLQASPPANIYSSTNCATVKSWLSNNAITNSFNATGNATSYTDSLSLLGGQPRVAYQNLQGLTQVKNNNNQWQNIKTVSIKNNTGSWDKVSAVYVKTDSGWQPVFGSTT